MSNQLAVIGEKQIAVKEFKGQRVVTFKDIDAVHERADGTAARNFRDNRARFIEKEDYFKICADEIRSYKITEISNKARGEIIFLTEQGYLMLVKSFTGDLARQVQRQLVSKYFKNGKSLELAFQLIEEFKAEIGSEIMGLKEQALFNHRPSHVTKLNWDRVIKNYSKCSADEENIKHIVFARFSISKWEDLTSDKFTEVFGYIREIAEKANLIDQVSLFE